jgi:cytochrome c oxidase subunit 2
LDRQKEHEVKASFQTSRLLLFLGVMLGALGPTAMAWGQDAPETHGETTVWLPTNVFPQTEVVDSLFNFILYLTSAVCIAVFGLMLYFLVKYRYKPGRQVIFCHGNPKLELVWTIVPAAIMVVIAAWGQASWAHLKYWPTVGPDEPAPVKIRVIAQQFRWLFQYPGEDGKLGPLKLELQVKASSVAEEMIGLDRNHPDAKDDFVIGRMVIPVNRKVFMELKSIDVLHSFFLPNFRVKQDAVPGLDGRMWLEASKTSSQIIGSDPKTPQLFYNAATEKNVHITDSKPFDILCAELCGSGHYTMRGMLFVVQPDQFEKFLNANKPAEGEEEDDFGF